MKSRVILAVAGLLLFFGGIGWYFHQAGAPRRAAIQTLSALNESLRANDSARLLEIIAVPAALRDRTTAEQFEFIAKALRDEITPEGLALLQREGEFGSLAELFSQEGIRWAVQAGVRPEDCVAFKNDRENLRTEVVLARPSTLNSQPSTTFQIVRCNNVVVPATVQLSTKDQR